MRFTVLAAMLALLCVVGCGKKAPKGDATMVFDGTKVTVEIGGKTTDYPIPEDMRDTQALLAVPGFQIMKFEEVWEGEGGDAVDKSRLHLQALSGEKVILTVGEQKTVPAAMVSVER